MKFINSYSFIFYINDTYNNSENLIFRLKILPKPNLGTSFITINASSKMNKTRVEEQTSSSRRVPLINVSSQTLTNLRLYITYRRKTLKYESTRKTRDA